MGVEPPSAGKSSCAQSALLPGSCLAMVTNTSGRRVVALVVPGLTQGGGVPAVAAFLSKIIESSGDFSLRVVSLATSAVDPLGVRLTKPTSWVRGVGRKEAVWDGRPYVEVGALGSELECLRYRPRRRLSEALAGADLIQVVSGSPCAGLAVQGLSVPVVLQTATRVIVERQRRQQVQRRPTDWWRWAMTRVIDRMDDRALRSADAVLVENSWMFRYATEVTAASGTWVRYAPPGVDTDLHKPGPTRRPGVPGTTPYILSVGRFDDPRKDVQLLLEAYGRLRNQLGDPPVRLVLAGSGQPGPAFSRRVRELKVEEHVDFHLGPSRAELVALYQGARCFALSSAEEGFGVVLIEAMACGIPVVATRCGGPEGIITEGTDGYLVPTGDVGALAHRLQQLVEGDERNRAMGLAARRTVERKFSQSVAGEPFLDTYRTLLAARTPRL